MQASSSESELICERADQRTSSSENQIKEKAHQRGSSSESELLQSSGSLEHTKAYYGIPMYPSHGHVQASSSESELICERADQTISSSENQIKEKTHQRGSSSESELLRGHAHQRKLIREHTHQILQSELLNTWKDKTNCYDNWLSLKSIDSKQVRANVT